MGGRHLATLNNSTTYYDHADWLDTERARSIPGATAPCERITSLPFGDGQATTGNCGDPSPMHFTGKERDSESGLDNFGARYDSSQYGRFMSPDWSAIAEPVPYANFANPQTLNLYAIVHDNPETFADLDGHDGSLRDHFSPLFIELWDALVGGYGLSADTAQAQSAQQQQTQTSNDQQQVQGSAVDGTIGTDGEGIPLVKPGVIFQIRPNSDLDLHPGRATTDTTLENSKGVVPGAAVSYRVDVSNAGNITSTVNGRPKDSMNVARPTFVVYVDGNIKYAGAGNIHISIRQGKQQISINTSVRVMPGETSRSFDRSVSGLISGRHDIVLP